MWVGYSLHRQPDFGYLGRFSREPGRYELGGMSSLDLILPPGCKVGWSKQPGMRWPMP